MFTGQQILIGSIIEIKNSYYRNEKIENAYFLHKRLKFYGQLMPTAINGRNCFQIYNFLSE